MVSNGKKPETVAKRLKRLRLARGMSQRDLSGPGVSYAYISRIEAGARTPSVKALRKLAGKLSVTVEYLETGEDRTMTDVLLADLRAAAEKPPRIGFDGDRVRVRCEVGEAKLSRHGSTLTEALFAVLAAVREAEELRKAAGELLVRANEIEVGKRRR